MGQYRGNGHREYAPHFSFEFLNEHCTGSEIIIFRMEEVIVISYLFNIVGQHREIHTEVRAFGFDWWFEKDGAKAQPASSKENDPEWGYTLQQKIRNDFIWIRWTISYGP